MDITISTPALLFSAISLLLLAFTTRFTYLGGLVRELHSQFSTQGGHSLKAQITNLRRRLHLIRGTQALGVLSFALCIVSMFVILWGYNGAAKWVFGASLTFMLVALICSLCEIIISTKALEIQLSECGDGPGEGSCQD